MPAKEASWEAKFDLTKWGLLELYEIHLIKSIYAKPT